MQTPGDYIGKLTKIFCEAFGVSYKRLSAQEKMKTAVVGMAFPATAGLGGNIQF